MQPDPMTRVHAPALGLIVMGALSGIITIMSLVFTLFGGTAFGMEPAGAAVVGVAAAPLADSDDLLPIILLVLGGGIVRLVLDVVIFVAGLRMRRLQNWTLCMVGAVAAILPCSPCVFLGLPMGIWAVVVLIDRDVKRSFAV